MGHRHNGHHHPDTVIDLGKPVNFTGGLEFNNLTAVMGPSGAGKSTLLDGLAGRIASGSLKGRVSLDGTDVSPSLIKRTSAYIMQDDRLFPMQELTSKLFLYTAIIQQNQAANKDGLAIAVPTWSSSSSRRRSRVSSISFNDANLLFVVASNWTRKSKRRRKLREI